MGQTISEIGRLRVAELIASGSWVCLLFNTAMVRGETRVDGSGPGDQKRDGQRARG